MTNSFLDDSGVNRETSGAIADFGDWRQEALAARDGVALFDRSLRDRIAARGTEVAPFLNRLLSFAMNDVPIGGGCRPFMLDARGRIVLAFSYLRVAEHEVYLDAPTGHGENIHTRIDMFHFGEDFTMEDIRTQTSMMTIAGPQAPACLTELGLPIPDSKWEHHSGEVEGEPVRVVRSAHLKRPCFDLWCDPTARPRIWQKLIDSGAVPAGDRALEVARVEDGVPVYPSEFGEHCTPLDASGADGLTDGKGCYPGQEVIERTLALGRPARRLIAIESDDAFTAGDELTAEGASVGVVTSSCESPESRWLGLALVKTRASESTNFLVSGSTVRRRDTED